jgi:hypothetical protein
MLVPSAQTVIAFRTSAAGVGQGAGAASSAARDNPSPGAAADRTMIAAVVVGCLAAVGASGWFIRLIRRRRRT